MAKIVVRLRDLNRGEKVCIDEATDVRSHEDWRLLLDSRYKLRRRRSSIGQVFGALAHEWWRSDQLGHDDWVGNERQRGGLQQQ